MPKQGKKSDPLSKGAFAGTRLATDAKQARHDGEQHSDWTLELTGCEVLSVNDFKRVCVAAPDVAPPYWQDFINAAAGGSEKVLFCRTPKIVGYPSAAVARCRYLACHKAVHQPFGGF